MLESSSLPEAHTAQTAGSATIFNYHREMVKLNGADSSLALGWRDKKSQFVRFEALSGIAILSGYSVIDAGCGYGDLLPHLTSLYGPFNYTGIEQIPEFYNKALKRFANWQGTAFINADFTLMDLPLRDYVLASGSLNYKHKDPDFIFKIIAKLYASCSRGLAFNLLRDIVPNELIVAYEPEQILNYCQKLSPKVKLIDSYAEEDFTIYMYR